MVFLWVKGRLQLVNIVSPIISGQRGLEVMVWPQSRWQCDRFHCGTQQSRPLPFRVTVYADVAREFLRNIDQWHIEVCLGRNRVQRLRLICVPLGLVVL